MNNHRNYLILFLNDGMEITFGFWTNSKYYISKGKKIAIEKYQTAVTAEKCNLNSISHKCFLHCFCFGSSISVKKWTGVIGLLRPIYKHFLLKKGVPIFLHIFIFYHYPRSLLKCHFFCCLFSLLLTVVSSSFPSIFNDEVLTMGKVIEKKGVLKRYFDSPEHQKSLSRLILNFSFFAANSSWSRLSGPGGPTW